MEKKTHLAFGNAVSLSVLRSTTITGLLITVGVSTLSSILPDVDLKNSDIDKLFDKLMIILCTFLITCCALDHIFNLGLIDIIKDFKSIPKYIVSIVVLIILSFMSSKTPHRSFTHSIIALIIFSSVVKFGFNNEVLFPFVIGYFSHIFLDIFNMSGISLLYPIRKRMRFNLCDSHGFANNLIFYLSCIVNVFAVLILIAKILV